MEQYETLLLFDLPNSKEKVIDLWCLFLKFGGNELITSHRLVFIFIKNNLDFEMCNLHHQCMQAAELRNLHLINEGKLKGNCQ